MGFWGGISGFSSGGMGYAEKEAQRVMAQRVGRSSGARTGAARVAKTVGSSSGAKASGRGSRLFGEVLRAFKSMGPMG